MLFCILLIQFCITIQGWYSPRPIRWHITCFGGKRSRKFRSFRGLRILPETSSDGNAERVMQCSGERNCRYVSVVYCCKICLPSCSIVFHLGFLAAFFSSFTLCPT